MKAAVIREYGKIVMEEVAKPILLDKHVLVKVKYASICGSDQHIFKGEFHPRTKLPLIPGHEFAGVIEDVSTEVKNLLPGDKVTVDPVSSAIEVAASRALSPPPTTSTCMPRYCSASIRR